MAFPKSVKQLCTPAYIYFLLSVIGIIIAIVQNVGNRRTYSLSSMNVPVPSTIMVFVVKVIGILFWTWILNLMCKDGHKEIAWFLVLLPFVLLFFMMGTAEGFQSVAAPKAGAAPGAMTGAMQAPPAAPAAPGAMQPGAMQAPPAATTGLLGAAAPAAAYVAPPAAMQPKK